MGGTGGWHGVLGVQFADEQRAQIDRVVGGTERFAAEGFAEEGAPNEAQAKTEDRKTETENFAPHF